MALNPREAAGTGGAEAIPAEFQAFTGIAELWDLSTDEQMKILGSPPRSTFFKWKKEGGPLPGDIRERISHVLSIFKCLQILFTTEQQGDQWIKKPNRFFDGTSALDVMLGGQVVDLVKVRQYLDAQRGG